jgi:CelD/BcsL family acetyltransferase involved in cellulose biosynthesis
VSEEAVTVAPFAKLPDDPADYVVPKSKAARDRKRLQKLGAHYLVLDPSATEDGLASLRRLHDEQWGERSGFTGSFALFANAARAGAARGELVFHALVAEERVIAIAAWFEVAGRTSYYQAGRDTTDKRWQGAGNALIACIAERAIKLGFTELDLLRGDESYKAMWSTESRSVVRLRASVGLGGLAARTAITTGTSARRVVGRATRRFRSS